MIEIKPFDYESEKYDMCGNTTHATLVINNIRIPLCGECIEELKEASERFNNTLFCHKCNNFVMNESGVMYGGSCKKWAEIDNKEITKENAGYSYCVDFMGTCRFIKDNMVYKIYADDCGNDPCSDDCNTCRYGYWKCKLVPFNKEYYDELGKTVFLLREDAENKCEEIMKKNRKLLEEERVD